MPIAKKAFLTGITGQDGSYLVELLIEKGYEVHGIIRRSSTFNTSRIDHLYHDRSINGVQLFLHYGDLNDSVNLVKLLYQIRPDEIYHLGAQSHVRVSFDIPEYTGDVTGLSTVRLLEAIRETGIDTRFYQASSSEMFGAAEEVPQNERTRFHPRSPYACAKVFSFHTTINYRESYNVFACNGILFNHESPRRGETFVTRKITRAAGRLKLGLQRKLHLGTLDARRDWGYAPDYVEAMWRMLQQDKPDDYVVATGESHSVREFLELAFSKLDLDWHDFVETDPRYYRPAEVDHLKGDYSRAKSELGWSPTASFDDIVSRMVASDYELAEKEALLAKKSVVQKEIPKTRRKRQDRYPAESRNKKQIIFVADRAQMRVYRQAWALKHQYPEQELILAARKVEESFFRPVFDNIYIYKNESDLATFIAENHPLVYHVHAETNAEAALVVERSTVPVIYDTRDFSGLRFGIEDLASEERDKERYALEKAAAFVLRFDPSILDYYRRQQYHIDAPVLQHLDYCVSDFCDTELPEFESPHVVYAAPLSPSRLPKSRYGHLQLLDIIKEIVTQKIHFHLYIDRWQMEENSEYQDYIDLGRESQYLHFGYSLPQPELQRTISRLHYGSMLKRPASDHQRLFTEYTMGNEIATYFEAGLPILVSSHFTQAARTLTGLDVAVEIPISEISKLCQYLSEADYMSLWRNVLRIRESEFSALENVHALMDFYQRL